MELTKQQAIDILKKIVNARILSSAAYDVGILDHEGFAAVITLSDIINALERK